MKRERTKEEKDARHSFYEKLKFYKYVKSQVTVDYFGNGDIYIPTFKNYNNGRIIIGSIHDKDFDHKRRGLTLEILKNLQKCPGSEILYPKESDDAMLLSHYSSIIRLHCPSVSKNKIKFGQEKYKLKRQLKEAHFKGTEFPYHKMPIEMLKLEAQIIADATDNTEYLFYPIYG